MLSKKRQKEIKLAIQEAFNEFYCQPEYEDNPEFWLSEDRNTYDMINSIDAKIDMDLNKLFNDWSKSK